MSKIPSSNISERITAPTEMLEPAVGELLRRISETWQTYNPDDLTETQSQALFLLVAAGMVERRERMRMRFADHPVIAEATITFTGENGGLEALQALCTNFWPDWKDAFQSWQQSEAAGDLPAHCEHLEPSEWRLTDQGVIARTDLDAPPDEDIPAEVRRQYVFDFVLKRGVFKDRDSVRGTGALVKMNKAKADSAPAAVNIGNWSEGGDAFAQALSPMMTKAIAEAFTPANGGGSGKAVVEETSTKTRHQPESDPKEPYMPADWFKDEFGLSAESLRGQARRGNLATIKRGHWNQYSVPDAMAIWPQLVTYGPNERK